MEATTEMPAHFNSWILKLVDKVQLYKLCRDLPTSHAEEISNGRPYYTDLMKSCYASGAPYRVIFEDETVVFDGWFHRTMAAIDRAEELSTVWQHLTQL